MFSKVVFFRLKHALFSSNHIFYVGSRGHPALFTSRQSFSRWMPPLPWLLHTFRPSWQSAVSLEADGSVAETGAPKLPFSLDNRPSLPPMSLLLCP